VVDDFGVEGEDRVAVEFLLEDGAGGEAVAEDGDLVAAFVGVAAGGVDADGGDGACEDDVFDAVALEEVVEVGVDEGVKATFAGDFEDAIVEGGEFVDRGGAVGSGLEGADVFDGFEDADGFGEFFVVGGEEDGGGDDEGGGMTEFGEEVDGVFEDVVGFGGGFDDAVEGAVGGEVVVLVADEDEGGFVGVHGFRLAKMVGHGWLRP
jgi:hypothetical protein